MQAVPTLLPRLLPLLRSIVFVQKYYKPFSVSRTLRVESGTLFSQQAQQLHSSSLARLSLEWPIVLVSVPNGITYEFSWYKGGCVGGVTRSKGHWAWRWR